MLFFKRYDNINKLISAKTEYGRLAQLVEHLLDVQEVTGSSPVPSTTSPQTKKVWGLFSWWRYRTKTARAERSEGNQSPSGALISARFPTHRNVYRDDCRFVVDGTGLEQQRRRPPPAAETGSRGWGRVLIFQSPARGLRKNQQTQPVQAPAVRFRQGSQRLGMSTKKDAARPFGLGTFFVVDGTGREPERANAGYHRSDGILHFVLYGAFWGNRCVRAYRESVYTSGKV